MPELPEVETIKLELNKLIKGKKIKSVEIRLPKEIKTPKNKFLKSVQGAKIEKVWRRAKILVVGLDNGYHLVFHLKLTGQLIYKYPGYSRKSMSHQSVFSENLPNKHSHLIFNFTDGSKLFFNDPRQFGWVRLVNNKELTEIFSEFGPEPLAKEFTFEKFKELVSKRKTAPIKPLLMDQKFLAGVGNIYSQEACFCAGVLPTRSANAINERELEKIYNCLRKILKLAISKKGSSVEYYVDVFGERGNMVPWLKVYGREGKKCKRCGAIIKSIKQRQRTTYYCPKCQK